MSVLIDTRPSDAARNDRGTDITATLRDRLPAILPVLAAVAVAALVLGVATQSAVAIIAGGFGAAILVRSMATIAQISVAKPTGR